MTRAIRTAPSDWPPRTLPGCRRMIEARSTTQSPGIGRHGSERSTITPWGQSPPTNAANAAWTIRQARERSVSLPSRQSTDCDLASGLTHQSCRGFWFQKGPTKEKPIPLPSISARRY
jgi:hypothetical protein